MLNIIFFISQSLFLLLLTLLLLFLSVYRTRRQKKEQYYFEQFKETLFDAFLRQQTRCSLAKVSSLTAKRALLKILEEIDRNYTDPTWKTLLTFVSTTYLRSDKLRYRLRSSWKKRNFAARCTRLCPEIEDQERIIQMLHDPSFSIRCLGSEASLRLFDKPLLLEVLKTMLKETPSSLYAYRSLFSLMRGRRIVDLLLDIYTHLPAEDPLRISCLEGLSVLSLVGVPLPIQEDIRSPNPKLRKTASRFLAKQANDRHLSLLEEAAKDTLREVRQHVAQGLLRVTKKEKYPLLKELLQDKEWYVRLAAATTLVRSGEAGRAILSEQDGSLGSFGYDVSRYILSQYQMGVFS